MAAKASANCGMSALVLVSAALFFACTMALPGRARAQTVDPAQSAAASDQPASEPGFFTGLFAPSRSNLLGTMGGLRTVLGNFGISLGLQETSEVFGNVTGGTQQGAAYDGLTELSIGVDTEKAFGWPGGTFNVSALQIHGSDLSAENLLNLQTISGIEAEPATRLWELWYQQQFLGDKIDVKIGQQSLDQEFMISHYSGDFINTMTGWPIVPSSDLYAGGPAYPLSSLGIRFRAQPTGALTFLAGVFDDNPPGGSFYNDPQTLGPERWGTKFNLNTGALIIAELQYAINQPALGQIAYGSHPGGLPGTYKIGFWYDTGWFPDQQFDNTGLSLANPNSTGIPMMHKGNFSIYGVMDQMLWRPDPQGPRSLNVFLRMEGAPLSDRNLITVGTNGGVVLTDPLLGRDNDYVGVGFGLAKVSGSVQAFDQQTGFFTNTFYPVRTVETFVELVYQYQVAPWWQVLPDFQYIFNPGGGIPNPNNPSTRILNEAVLGVRTVITF
jgi:porin